MAIKKLLMTALFAAATAFVMSQEFDPEEPELNYMNDGVIDSAEALRLKTEQEIAENNRIVQPVSWESAGEALKYEIVIHRRSERPLSNGSYSYTEIYRHETNEEETEECTIFLDPTLPAGNYRLTIYVYNVLGILEEDYTKTEDFFILQAHLPEVRRVSYPLNTGDTIYLDDGDNNGIIRATGKNLFELQEAEDDFSYMNYTLTSDRRTLYARDIISLKPDNSEVELLFDVKQMGVGVYQFAAVDASGLHSIPDRNTEITIKFKKLFDLDLSLGYMCPIVIFDDTMKKYTDTMSWPVSLATRVTFIAYKQLWGYLGIGASLYGSRFYGNGTVAEYDIDGNFFSSQLNLVYQKPFYFKNRQTGHSSHRLTLDVHAGAGMTMFNGVTFHFEHDIKSDPLNSFNFSVDAGAAMQVYITKRLYIEGCVDFLMAYVPFPDAPDGKGPVDMLLGSVIPIVSVGWQF